MKKKYIVKESEDFTKIIKNGRYSKTNSFVIYSMENKLDHNRFGISVGKKVGNAVVRNKVKRQLRMIIDSYRYIYKDGFDYVIIVRSNYINNSFDEIKNMYEVAIKKLIKN